MNSRRALEHVSDATDGPRGESSARWSRRDAGIVACIGLVVILAHGWSVDDGLALDDHWHYHSVRSCGWSWSELLGATTIDTKDLVDVWWQETPVRFRYARPVAVALLKVTYALTGGSVLAPHFVSLGLHFVASVLVFRLCLLLTRSRLWAAFGGCAFAAYPLSVFAVSWLAAQNMVLVTVLLLAALLCYIRASGLRFDGGIPGPPAGLKWGAFALVVVLWVMALFSRENAVMLPAILVALDLCCGGWRQVKSRLPAYAVLAAIGIAFLAWRLVYYYEPMPDVYVRRPGTPGYVLWCFAKLLHYVCCAVFPAPMTLGPTGRYQPFTEAPWDCLLMAVIVVTMVGLYWWRARSACCWWVWLLWILLAVLPVVPVLATPHSGYLCGVGAAVGLAVALSQRRGETVRTSRGTAVFAVAVLVLYAGSVKAGQLMWKSIVHAEALTIEGFRFDPPPPQITDVFAINLPFSAIYAKQCLVESNGPAMENLNWHVLTFAPHLLRTEQPCAIERTSERSLTVRIEGPPFFSGLLGRFLTTGFGHEGRFKEGESFRNDLCEVRVEQAGEAGVQALRFTFAEPLDSPRYCFYVTSKNCGAMRLRFTENRDAVEAVELNERPTQADLEDAIRRVRTGEADAGDTLCAALLSSGDESAGVKRRAARGILFAVAEALAAPEQRLLDTDEDATANAGRIAAWWRANVDKRVLLALFHDEDSRRDIRHRRDEVKRARTLVSRFLRTDLYLTGDPFPGPQ